MIIVLITEMVLCTKILILQRAVFLRFQWLEIGNSFVNTVFQFELENNCYISRKVEIWRRQKIKFNYVKNFVFYELWNIDLLKNLMSDIFLIRKKTKTHFRTNFWPFCTFFDLLSWNIVLNVRAKIDGFYQKAVTDEQTGTNFAQLEDE